MAIFQITSANSVTTTEPSDDAFKSDSPAADTLIVNTGASLKAEGSSAFGAFLDNTGPWTVQVNGLIRSAKSIGLNLEPGNSALSTISVGATGEINGNSYGIYSVSAATITNAGKIAGANTAILCDGLAPHTIKNSGQLLGGNFSILASQSADTVINSGFVEGHILLQEGNDRLINSKTIFDLVDMGIGDDTVTNSKAAVMHDDIRLGGGHDTLANSGSIGRSVEGGEGNDTIKNTGAIGKDVLLGNGLNSLTSSGTIYGQVSGGSDKDVVKNSGLIEGIVDLGGGDDNFTGGRHTEIVIDNAASDIVKLGGGDDFYFGIGNFNQAEDGLDLVDGGAGFDSYNAASATDSVYINLDNKPHDFSPFLPGAGLIAANTATGIGLSIDTIRNFEAVVGGAGSDIIYGSASGNLIVGGDGFDTLAGFGGNDVLIGGDGGDALWGGAGRDYLTGGAGADFFQFAAISESRLTLATRDAIMDFESGLDLIDLRPIDANSKSRTTDDAFTFIGDQAFSKVAGQLRAYAITGGQIVEGDVNGDGKADFSIEVVATPATLTLTAADFLL